MKTAFNVADEILDRLTDVENTPDLRGKAAELIAEYADRFRPKWMPLPPKPETV